MSIDCTRFRRHLGDWLDGQLAEIEAGEQVTHAAGCPDCAGTLAAERRLRAQLRDLRVPPMRPGLPGQLFRHVRELHGVRAPDRRRDAVFALGGAAAASLLLAAILAARGPVFLPHAPTSVAGTPVSMETVSLSPGDVEVVALRIEAPRDFANVRFSIELPDQVWLADQPGLRVVAWDGALRKGENVLELPLVAQPGATGTLVAAVAWGDFQQRLQTKLTTRSTTPSPTSSLGGA
ncbi:MAG TPA: zf-HC2 domain-containing protein [Nevskiaceae bacterium]|nr:zf-HC2 domain-containing protein [Nevskiaceae bacterium]